MILSLLKFMVRVPVLIWELAVVRMFLYSLVCAGSQLIVALTQLDWSDRTGSQKTILILQLLGVQVGVVLAFIDQSADQLRRLAANNSTPINPPLNPEPKS
jgi:hypothetical protein